MLKMPDTTFRQRTQRKQVVIFLPLETIRFLGYMTTSPWDDINGQHIYVCLFINEPCLVDDKFLKGISLFTFIGANMGSSQIQKNQKIKERNQTEVRNKRGLEEEIRITEICISLKALELECKKQKNIADGDHSLKRLK